MAMTNSGTFTVMIATLSPSPTHCSTSQPATWRLACIASA